MEEGKLTVGVAMIAKNEMEFIARALDSVKDADQIVVCDTGSNDNGETIRIAQEHGATVFDDYKWEDSFAKARNHVKSKMTTDWILSLDCDEYIHDFSKVREAVKLATEQGIRCVNVTQHADDSSKQVNIFPRLFKNDPDIVWHGAAHNYLSVFGKDAGDVHLTYGFSLAHLSDPDRTLRILQKAYDSKEAGAREKYYLAREYYYRGRYKECTRMAGEYVQESQFLMEKADAFLMMARSYWAQGMGEDARDACLQAIKINPNFKEAILFMSELVWPKHSDQWKRMAETADNSEVLFIRTQ